MHQIKDDVDLQNHKNLHSKRISLSNAVAFFFTLAVDFHLGFSIFSFVWNFTNFLIRFGKSCGDESRWRLYKENFVARDDCKRQMDSVVLSFNQYLRRPPVQLAVRETCNVS